MTAEILAKAPYARAVLKEVFRMNPISVGVGRIATQDLVLQGFLIPKGVGHSECISSICAVFMNSVDSTQSFLFQTNLVTQNQVACRLNKYFERPNEFIPERWLKGSPIQVKDNPYLVLPFGHGSRSCIARRLAEQHLLTLLLRVCVISKSDHS